MADGLLVIWKEKGYTSHDVVARMRGILKQKKIGHTGTLDPQAEGVLCVGIGTGTKALDLLPDKDKCYEAEVLFGVETDTQDIWGEVISSEEFIPDRDKLQEALSRFTGEILQVPPMYSAKKVGGKKLYELAREGKTIERAAVPVTVHELSLLSLTGSRARLSVRCSAGTYIRTLCADLGEALGTKACMSSLTRTMACGFTAQQAVTLKELKETDRLPLIPVDEALSCYPAVILPLTDEKACRNGNAVKAEAEAEEGQLCRLYLEGGEFIGIYRAQPEKWLKPVKVFYRRD